MRGRPTRAAPGSVSVSSAARTTAAETSAIVTPRAPNEPRSEVATSPSVDEHEVQAGDQRREHAVLLRRAPGMSTLHRCYAAASGLAGALRVLTMGRSRRASEGDAMVQVRVAGVALDASGQHVILLKPIDEIPGEGLLLPIWIGQLEATSILVAIEHAPVPRPMAHDLMLSMHRDARRRGRAHRGDPHRRGHVLRRDHALDGDRCAGRGRATVGCRRPRVAHRRRRSGSPTP